PIPLFDRDWPFLRPNLRRKAERRAQAPSRMAPCATAAGGSSLTVPSTALRWLGRERRKPAGGILTLSCPERRLITDKINGRDEWIRRDQSRAHRTAGPRSAAEARMGRPKKPRCCREHEVLQRFD